MHVFTPAIVGWMASGVNYQILPSPRRCRARRRWSLGEKSEWQRAYHESIEPRKSPDEVRSAASRAEAKRLALCETSFASLLREKRGQHFPGTRDWLFVEIEQWRTDKDGSKLS